MREPDGMDMCWKAPMSYCLQIHILLQRICPVSNGNTWLLHWHSLYKNNKFESKYEIFHKSARLPKTKPYAKHACLSSRIIRWIKGQNRTNDSMQIQCSWDTMQTWLLLYTVVRWRWPLQDQRGSFIKHDHLKIKSSFTMSTF